MIQFRGLEFSQLKDYGLVKFKNSMLLGLYIAELRKTCLMFMPKEIKHKREIKAVLDHQLVNLRTYNLDPRAPAQDMAGLQSTYRYDKSEITKDSMDKSSPSLEKYKWKPEWNFLLGW